MHMMIWYDVMHIAKTFFKKSNPSFCVSVYGAIHLNIFKTHCNYWMTQHVFAKSGKGLELDKTYKLLFHFFFSLGVKLIRGREARGSHVLVLNSFPSNKNFKHFTAPFWEWESTTSRLHSYWKNTVFLTLIPQGALVLIWLIWKDERLSWPWSHPGTPGLGI